MNEQSGATHRDLLASLVMGGGLLLAYGALAPEEAEALQQMYAERYNQ